YGNESKAYDLGTLHVMRDEMLDKRLWDLPDTGEDIGIDTLGNPVYMSTGDFYEGKTTNLIDGIIEYATGTDKFIPNTTYFGDTWVVNGVDVNRNPSWNVIIDLGDYYRLSRIVTHQTWNVNDEYSSGQVGLFYGRDNVGRYKVYYLDEASNVWKLIGEEKIIARPPNNYTDMEIIFFAEAGDEVFMYPDDPDFTPRTRYFRYEKIAGFLGVGDKLTEITLYGK
ncbi:DUF5000 domain-containing lipoprotein, partial [Candidatus Symbiothrix dinenymphae]|uniref:DUF5000 domain-containing lipoprotein n=1 Tax=Candidatus Symbiothrix dinenymphae TaxID=467085 RepID=UPI000AA3F4D9